jgi:hypothetical protein
MDSIPMDLRLQPLRVPAGWLIDWNTLYEVDPSEGPLDGGYFGGSSLFLASHMHRRFLIDVGWQPEDDPRGCYRMLVVYAPWDRTPKGRRKKVEGLGFDWANPVHEFQTRFRPELVKELEAWLMRCANWVREGS